MYILPVITLLLLGGSALRDVRKTRRALMVATRRFINVLPPFFAMIALMSISLHLIPESVISHYLSDNSLYWAALYAALLGSVVFMPGFIVFPLSGILLTSGVPRMVIAAFSTTLMMVGILTFPLERAYFGTRITLIRNGIGFSIAVIVAICIGLFYGEIP